MFQNLACAAIAYFLARYLNARFPGWLTAAWSSLVALIAGIVGGVSLVIAGLAAFGVSAEHAAPLGRIDKALGQAFIWSVLGTAAGIYQGRRIAATGERGSIANIPLKSWIGWSALTVAAFFAVLYLANWSTLDGARDPQTAVTPQASIQPAVNAPPAPQPQESAKDSFDPSTARPVGHGDFDPTTAVLVPSEVRAQEAHMEKIYAAHPDADQVFESLGFKTWLSNNPAYQRVPAEGSTQQVIAMFTAYKTTLAAPRKDWDAATVKRNEAAAEALSQQYNPYQR